MEIVDGFKTPKKRQSKSRPKTRQDKEAVARMARVIVHHYGLTRSAFTAAQWRQIEQIDRLLNPHDQ